MIVSCATYHAWQQRDLAWQLLMKKKTYGHEIVLSDATLYQSIVYRCTPSTLSLIVRWDGNPTQPGRDQMQDWRLYVLSEVWGCHHTNFQTPGCYWEIRNGKSNNTFCPTPRSTVAITRPTANHDIKRNVDRLIISLAFHNYIRVGFQSVPMQLNTSILHGANAYLTYTTQLLGNMIPLGDTDYQTFELLTIRNVCQTTMNGSRDPHFSCFPRHEGVTPPTSKLGANPLILCPIWESNPVPTIYSLTDWTRNFQNYLTYTYKDLIWQMAG